MRLLKKSFQKKIKCFILNQIILLIKKFQFLYMEKEEYITIIMSFSEGAEYTPIQLQKLFFLLDKNIGDKIGGPFFNFMPYHYGPFDKEVYTCISRLKNKNLIIESFDIDDNIRRYKLSINGQKMGENLQNKLNLSYHNYIRKIDKFVRKLSFSDLILSIYKAYPEMKANSIFKV